MGECFIPQLAPRAGNVIWGSGQTLNPADTVARGQGSQPWGLRQGAKLAGGLEHRGGSSFSWVHFLNLLLFILLGKQTDDRQSFHLLVHSQAGARRPEIHPGLVCDWQPPKYWNHHLLPARVCISKMLKPQAESGLEPRLLDRKRQALA